MFTSDEQLVKQEESPPQRSSAMEKRDGLAGLGEGNSRVFAKTGQWSQEEKNKYLQFLRQNQRRLMQKQPETMRTLYVELSHVVRSRKANQCRLYHQKMEKYYQSVPAIIEYLANNMSSEPQLRADALKRTQEIIVKEVASSDGAGILRQELPNKEIQLNEERMQGGRGRKQRRISIRLEEKEGNKDHGLVKTDQSLHLPPSLPTLHSQPVQARPTLPFKFNFTELLHPSPYSLPQNGFSSTFLHGYRPLEYHPNPVNDSYSFFFPSYEAPTGPLVARQREWRECQSLFEAWQQKSKRLLLEDDNQNS